MIGDRPIAIEVDGGITAQTVSPVVAAGANVLVTVLLLLLAAVVIWAFAESRTAGAAVAAVVGVIAALGLGYYVWRDVSGSRTATTPPAARERAPAPEQFKRSLTALQPSDIVLPNLKLENNVETFSGIDGVQRQRPARGSWVLSGEVKNLASEQSVRDVSLKVRLFSCPSYFTASLDEVKVEELVSVCTRIGETSVGLYDLAVPPGATAPFTRTVTFRNQGRADNWRFWVDVTRVVAQISASDPSASGRHNTTSNAHHARTPIFAACAIAAEP